MDEVHEAEDIREHFVENNMDVSAHYHSDNIQFQPMITFYQEGQLTFLNL